MSWRAPRLVTRSRGGGFTLHLGAEERSAIAGLLGELRDLITGGDADAPGLARLFPVAHPDDPDQEAEYQRLMRDELVESRVTAIDRVGEVLGGGGRKVTLDGAALSDLMQALNGVRLVLGTLLDVQEDDEPEDVAASAEYGLYAFLSYLLDSCVEAASAPE